jgi:mono/diheme cytochrome c family protein
MNAALKRLAIAGIFAIVLLTLFELWAYDVIKIDFLSFMEIQPSFSMQEDPLPVPPRSIPIEGPAYIPNMGAPSNPVSADDVSLQRGQTLFKINCIMCHGETGEGNGQLSSIIQNKPANLTSIITQSKTDGALFMTITNGVEGKMPPMVENTTVRDRWDLVNYIRTLKPAAQ